MARSFVAVTAGSGTKLATTNYTDGADSKHDEVVTQGESVLPSYTITLAPSTATANSHLLQIMAGASLRVRVRRIMVYQRTLATAAAYIQLAIYRLTTAGTGGAVLTPSALDLTDSASGATAMQLPTVKGTEGVQLWTGSGYLMQTAGASTPQVQPIVDIDLDRMHSRPIVISAGATNGIALKNTTANAGGVLDITVIVDESPY